MLWFCLFVCLFVCLIWFFTSSLDKQRICVNTQLKSSKKAIKIKCVRTEKQFRRSVCNYMRCHCVPIGPFRFHLCNIQMPVGYWFFFTSERTVFLRHDSRNKVKHSWKISSAFAGNRTQVAPVKDQCSNHWAKESTPWRSCQRLIIY